MSPNLSQSVHRAFFSHEEFKQLCKDFPKQTDWLNKVVNKKFSAKVVIDIDTLKNFDHIDAKLYDRIYLQAYNAIHYLKEEKFISVLYQLKSVLRLPKSEVGSVLEIGKGIGLFNSLINNYDYNIKTLDIDPTYKPDINGDILNIPCKDSSFDVVCAFEVLQHIPSLELVNAFTEIARVSRRYVSISLPYQTGSIFIDAKVQFRQRFINRLSFSYRFFSLIKAKSILNRYEKLFLRREDKHNPHFWEAGTQSFPKEEIFRIITEVKLKVINESHNPAHPYHWFILCEKN